MQKDEQDIKSIASHTGSQQDSGMTLIAVLLCTLVRGTKLQEGKVSPLSLARHLNIT